MNLLAVALGNSVYLWNGNTSDTMQLMTANESVCSVNWINSGNCLAVGLKSGHIELWDTNKLQQIRDMEGHSDRVCSLSWNNHLLSSGGRDTKILNHDVRVRSHIFQNLVGHTQEVCALKWSPDGSLLASGGNDNLLCIWDINSTQGGGSNSNQFGRNRSLSVNSNNLFGGMGTSNNFGTLGANILPYGQIIQGSSLNSTESVFNLINGNTGNFNHNNGGNFLGVSSNLSNLGNNIGNFSNQNSEIININTNTNANNNFNNINNLFNHRGSANMPDSHSIWNIIEENEGTVSYPQNIQINPQTQTLNNQINSQIQNNQNLSLNNNTTNSGLNSHNSQNNPGMTTIQPKFVFNQHEAAVKALAWCPWQNRLLASGAGSKDKTIKFWNIDSGSLINSVDSGSQVCALLWSKHEKELISSHGYSKNQISIWKYPSMYKVSELNGHMSRVLYMGMSPDGCSIVSGAGDETLRFWKIHDNKKSSGDSVDYKMLNSFQLR
jgi:WD40 repeat protein